MVISNISLRVFMTLTLRLSASLRDLVEGYDPAGGMELELDPDRTVANVMERLGIPTAKVKIIMVNGRAASMDRVLADGDRLALFPPVGGG